MQRYILDEHSPVRCDSLPEWAAWFYTSNHHVARTTLPSGVEVSTVFLGRDHSFGGPTPILFETMIFGGQHDQYQERYATWEQAEAGHSRAVALAEAKP